MNISLLTRRRRAGEEIPYPFYYDEYIGRTPTGRIVKGWRNRNEFPGDIVLIYDYLEQVIEDLKDEIIEDESLEEPVIEKKILYTVEIHHHYGVTEFEEQNPEEWESYKEEYSKIVDNHFWDGFVKEIKIVEVE